MNVVTDRSVPELLLVFVAIVVGLTLLVGAWTAGTPFGIFTYTWEGTTELRSTATAAGVDQHVANNVSTYDAVEPVGTVALLLTPDSAYDANETASVQTFVESGGTLVIADANGTYTNPLLDDIGASTQINGTPLRDEREHYRSPTLPRTTTVGNHSAVAASDGLILNHGTVLEPNNATVLVQTSEFAYLDIGDNQQLNTSDPMASFPVVTVESVGDGEILVVSDPSVFINAMLAHEGNAAFVQGLFDDHQRVLFDVSHADEVPPLAAALLYVRGTPIVGAIAGLAGISAVGLLQRRTRGRSTDR